jgi:hypothetical protein
MFILGTALVKVSFALTLLRIIRLRLHRWGVYVALVAAVLMGIANFFLVLFTCKPIHAFWTTAEDPTSGTCHDISTQVAGSYVHGAVSLFVYVLLGIVLPAHLLYGLQMQTRVKLLAGFLLSLGSMCV